jgi:hypothetical protein
MVFIKLKISFFPLDTSMALPRGSALSEEKFVLSIKNSSKKKSENQVVLFLGKF